MFPSLIDRVIAIALAALVLVLAPTAAWNWYRKNVYYDALQTVAADKVRAVAAIEQDMREATAKLDTQYLERSFQREREHKKQVDEILGREPADRVVYKLRDRWLPSACPPGAAGDVEGPAVGGLHPEDELSLVRFAKSADDTVDERNHCAALYQAARDGALRANK